MKPAVRVLLIVIAAELILGIYWVGQRAVRPAPPSVDLSRLDPLTTEDLTELQNAARDGGARQWRELGEAYLGNGYYQAAEQCLHQAVQLDPRDIQSAYARGFCLERMGQTSEAIQVLQQVAASGADELAQTCAYQIGRCFLREENIEQAEAAFRSIPDFGPAAYQLAKLLIRTDRSQEALPLIEQQLAQTPNSLKLLQLKMRAAESLGQTELAQELRAQEDTAQYQLILEYGQSFISMFSVRYGLSQKLSAAMRLRTQGTLQQRQAAFSRLLPLILEGKMWQYRSVLIAAAHVELGLGNISQAQELVDLIERKTYEGLEVMDLKALLATSTGNFDTAYQHWQRACEMKPSAELYAQLAAAQGSLAEKNRERNQALETLFSGIDAYRANQMEMAEQLLSQATERLPDDPRAWHYLGEVQRRSGHDAVAVAAYDRALSLDPSHGRSIRAKELILKQKQSN